LRGVGGSGEQSDTKSKNIFGWGPGGCWKNPKNFFFPKPPPLSLNETEPKGRGVEKYCVWGKKKTSLNLKRGNGGNVGW